MLLEARRTSLTVPPVVRSLSLAAVYMAVNHAATEGSSFTATYIATAPREYLIMRGRDRNMPPECTVDGFDCKIDPHHFPGCFKAPIFNASDAVILGQHGGARSQHAPRGGHRRRVPGGV